jgi:dihydrofolate synthase/folylpolyglutamate synthase
MISSISDAEKYLSLFYEKVRQTTGSNVTVDRMWPLLAKVGNPQEKLRIIHVAGTSGKTSTSYFLAALLKESGCRVGLSISPHIINITERLQINGEPVSDEKFCNYLSEFIECIGDDPDASYFEYLIVFVLWVFAREGLDYTVLETGLGGMHDATNVCRRPDKICVITDIGLDHQQVLGYDLASIAAQKAGIIHAQNQVFMYEQSVEVMNSVEDRVKSVGAVLNRITEPVPDLDSQLVYYQQRNWDLSYKVFEYMSKRDGLKSLSKKSMLRSQVSVPGRMQIIKSGEQRYILDGAHNVQKIVAFVNSFQQKYPDLRVPVLLSIKLGKDYEQVISVLKPIMSKSFCVGFNKLQDMPQQSVDPKLLVDTCSKLNIPAVVLPSLNQAIVALKKSNEPIIIVTGSLYILGETINTLEMKS